MMVSDLNFSDYVRGEILASHSVWESLHGFTWGRGGVSNPADHSQYHKLAVASEVKEIDLSECIPPLLKHMYRRTGDDASNEGAVCSDEGGCGLVSVHGFPEFTNYTVDFKDWRQAVP